MSEDKKKLSDFLMKITLALAPEFDSIRCDLVDFKKKHHYSSQNDRDAIEKLANKYGDSIVAKYTSVGVATALPGAIPGIGTLIQIGAETGAITTDLALMIRWMGSMCIGIALLYDRDIESEFNQDFIKVLALWCGVLTSLKVAGKRIGTKVAIAQFKRIPGKVFTKINQRVGTVIIAKYGTKRGGVAIGRLVPFGAGALIGGVFNYFTMNSFKMAAIGFYKEQPDADLYVDKDIVG